MRRRWPVGQKGNRTVKVGHERVQQLVKQRVIRVAADRQRSYSIHLADGLVEGDCKELEQQMEGRKNLIVTTPYVARLYAERLQAKLASRFDVSLLVIPAREESKRMDYVTKICQHAQDLGFERQSLLIGLGGGVCTDIVTMAASMLRRGTPYIRIPTTLLGQIDGSIGVKGAVNFNTRKNSLGCYYSASSVFVDHRFLRTLTEEQISQGLAEIIKIAIARDSRLFDLVEEYAEELIETRFQMPGNIAMEIISRAVFGMVDELESNMYEDKTYQRLVDLGHTLSPAIESASGFTMPHGEAVAISLAWCSEFAREIGVLSEDACDRIIKCLQVCGLPVSSELLTTERVYEAIHEATRHRGGQLNLVVPARIGHAVFVESPDDVPASAVEAVQERISSLDNDPCKPNRFAPNRPVLVFDIGGTNLRGAIYDSRTGGLVRRASLPTPNHRRHPDLTTPKILALIRQGIEELSNQLLHGAMPANVAIAFAGPLNARNEVTAAPTIWGGDRCQAPIDLKSELQFLWREATVSVLNDVTAAGYRYLKHTNESLCVLTVGSGIGNKLFVNGRPFTGPAGRGGEMGHIVVDHAEDAIVCDCGGRGHLGGIASGRGTLASAQRQARLDPEGYRKSRLYAVSQDGVFTNEDLVECFHKQDMWTVGVIGYVAEKLANVLAHVHQAVGVERFVLMGGFCEALGEQYRQLLVEAARKDCWDSGQDWNTMIEIGTDDDDSGLIGAGRYACQFQEITIES